MVKTFKRKLIPALCLGLAACFLQAATVEAYFVETDPICVPNTCPEGCRIFVFFDDVTHEYEGFIEVGC